MIYFIIIYLVILVSFSFFVCFIDGRYPNYLYFTEMEYIFLACIFWPVTILFFAMKVFTVRLFNFSYYPLIRFYKLITSPWRYFHKLGKRSDPYGLHRGKM